MSGPFDTDDFHTFGVVPRRLSTPVDTLYAIGNADPAGWEFTEPTEKDNDSWRAWVVATYGQQALTDYFDQHRPE